MAKELFRRGLVVERRKPITIDIDGIRVDHAFRVDLLINFGAATMKEGLHRIVNGYLPSASPRLRVNLPSA